MDLMDELAASFAAALVHLDLDPADIALRAYDVAEAMVAERTSRLGLTEPSLDDGHYAGWVELAAAPGEPAELSAEDETLPEPEGFPPWWPDPQYSPRWDLEPRWSPEDIAASRPPDAVEGPGLASVKPAVAAAQKRSSG
jgi:hypothetical protein